MWADLETLGINVHHTLSFHYVVHLAGLEPVRRGLAARRNLRVGQTVANRHVRFVGVQKFTGLFGRRLQMFASLLIIALGILTIAGRWDLPISRAPASAQHPASLEEAIDHVEGLDSGKLPCCEHGS